MERAPTVPTLAKHFALNANYSYLKYDIAYERGVSSPLSTILYIRLYWLILATQRQKQMEKEKKRSKSSLSDYRLNAKRETFRHRTLHNDVVSGILMLPSHSCSVRVLLEKKKKEEKNKK